MKELLKEIKGLQDGSLMAHADGSVTKVKTEVIEECIMDSECECDNCKKETAFMNQWGDRL